MHELVVSRELSLHEVAAQDGCNWGGFGRRAVAPVDHSIRAPARYQKSRGRFARVVTVASVMRSLTGVSTAIACSLSNVTRVKRPFGSRRRQRASDMLIQ